MKNIININAAAGNATPFVRSALNNIKPGMLNRIVFEKGTYTFFKDGALRDMFYVSNNKSCKKDVIFPIINKSRVEIVGNGSTFLFCDRVTPFVIQNSDNITLSDFSIDFSFPRHCEGTVKSIDDEGFEIIIDKDKFPFEVKNGNIIFKTGTGILTTADRKLFLVDKSSAKHTVAYLFAGDSTESRENPAAPIISSDAYETKDGIYFKYREDTKKMKFNVGDFLFISNDENRENSVIFAEESEKLTINNVNVYRGAGMGLIAQMCTDVDLNGFNIHPLEERDTLLSITADAIHLVHCGGYAKIRNCCIEKTIDDAVNIHGAYSKVNEIINGTTVRVAFCHEEQSGLIPYRQGDTVHINDAESMCETGTAQICKVSYPKTREYIELIFSENITDIIHTGDFLENPDRMPEIYLCDNIIRSCPHMRISSSKKTVIKNNTLDLQICDIFISDLFRYWYESGTTTDVEISDNTFLSTHKNRNITVGSERKNNPKLHGRVIIKNNTFSQSRDDAIKAEYVQELVIKDNEFNK